MVRIWAAALALLWLSAMNSASAAPKVVVSIVPIHSLVAGVMEGIAEPQLLVPAGMSPHNYALKPSDARALQSADLVVWVGEALENYLEKPLTSLAGKARIVEISDMDGLMLLDMREGGSFDAHRHDDHAPEKPASPSRSKMFSTPQHVHHAGDDKDMHLWLDPDNARTIVTQIAAELSKLDAANAATYDANARKLHERIGTLEQGIKARLAPVQDRSYIVFHDAYQYFENHFGTKIVGSITVSPDQLPGAKRVAELRERIVTTSPVCVFREPQFASPIIDTLVAGTGVKIGVLDPEGANMAANGDAYFTLMNRIADSLATCLAPSS